MVLCIPVTGRAANRLEEVTGEESQTIHRLLGSAPLHVLRAKYEKRRKGQRRSSYSGASQTSEGDGDRTEIEEEWWEEQEEANRREDFGSGGAEDVKENLRWGWEFNAERPLGPKHVLADETSMVDVQLAHKFFRAVRWA